MNRLTTFAGVVFLSTLAGCDRCTAVFSCEQSPRIAIIGQILHESAGTPIRGATIEMRWVSGVNLLTNVASTTTNDEGSFALEVLAESLGDVVVSIQVATPGEQSYQVLAVPTHATVRTGEATVLRPWVSAHPALPYVIELFHNGTEDVRVVNSNVEFRRTGGVRLLDHGIEVNSVSAMTNDIGWVFPFQDKTTDAAGDLIGDLIVHLSPSDSVVVPGIGFSALATFAPQLGLLRLGIGPN